MNILINATKKKKIVSTQITVVHMRQLHNFYVTNLSLACIIVVSIDSFI